MYKKFIIFSLLIMSSCFFIESNEPVPYENVIAREYNRMRGGTGRYSSISNIMNQSLRGKSMEQKNQMIADLKSLKHAVNAALEQAKHDGKRMWYWGYIWKDNEPVIQTLAQYEYDISDKLAECEKELQSDFVRLLRYVSGMAGGALVGISALYLSQHYLSQENYLRDGKHGFIEMVAAPAAASLDVLALGTKYLLAAIVIGADGIKKTAGAGLSALSTVPPVMTPPQ